MCHHELNSESFLRTPFPLVALYSLERLTQMENNSILFVCVLRQGFTL